MLSLAIATTTPSPLSWDSALSPHIWVFDVAFLVSFVFTPIMRQVAMYYGIIDQPDQVRKLHKAPVAYLGGVAVFLGWVAGLAMGQVHIPIDEIGSPHLQVKLNIVLGAVVIVALGLWDDIKRIPPRNKIFFQAMTGIILLKGGVGSHCLDPVFNPVNYHLQIVFGPHFYLPHPIIDLLSWAFVVCIVVGCCNATNLMDGLDGLCGGVTAVIGAGFLFLAVQLAMFSLEPDWDAVRIVLALSLLGAVLGFIPYNFNPASIFMGDAGSMFLGYSCATLIILLAQEQARWLLAALVMFALPFLDTSLALVRRWVNRRPIFSADRHHFHHQLVARGLSIRKTVLILYGLAFGFCLLGVLIAYVRTRYAISIYLVIFGSIIVAAYKMGLVHEKLRVATAKPLGSKDAVIPTDMNPESSTLELPDPPPHTWPSNRSIHEKSDVDPPTSPPPV
jgi:UDP-GlcNAc:undecaprenyl-phosphate/decaprenyl-phosphate GlcNAc-1-phosphate transferase